MEETPDIPETDEVPEESRPYTLAHKAVAGLGVAACALLAFIFMDVIAGGRLTRALAGPPSPWEGDDSDD